MRFLLEQLRIANTHGQSNWISCEVEGCPNTATKIPVMRLYTDPKDQRPTEASMDLYVCETCAVGDSRLFIYGDEGWDQIVRSVAKQGAKVPVRELTRMKFVDIPKIKGGQA